MNIELICTDCNTSVAKMLREHPELQKVEHQHDVYHIEKRVAKKLTANANIKGNDSLLPWILPIRNHLWWSAQTCNENSDDLIERWQSSIYHTVNQHQWDYANHYKQCEHPPLSRNQQKKRKWLKKGSNAHEALINVVKDTRLVSDIRKLTKACHTGAIESFNSSMLRYAPKRTHFSLRGMIARTQLAVISHNANLNRPQAVDKQGNKRFKTVCPKRSKDWCAKPIYVAKNSSWRKQLLTTICKVQQQEVSVPALEPLDAPDNIAAKPKPPKRQLIDSHVSRFMNAN
jgi:hypothetical protein